MCWDFAVFFFQGALDRHCGDPEDGPLDRFRPLPTGVGFALGTLFLRRARSRGAAATLRRRGLVRRLPGPARFANQGELGPGSQTAAVSPLMAKANQRAQNIHHCQDD